VVVVVSEETGAISHAYKGTPGEGRDPRSLRAFLTSVLVPRRKPFPQCPRLVCVPWLKTASGPAPPSSPRNDPEVETKTEHR